ncbi:hypothetical protein BDW02DRAFT_568650 [Decorospora gaudefroyi]|uniref:Uncharacterized protein n=1 Tax=Decorospora gaudefroyi TaxID=184978 RepID=A0A6A5KGS9_9PLEO|nr:hypothetical protein BDW02DRAFT_568650 [Decorospora gaudefroyi]
MSNTRTRSPLRISSTPFKSSFLSIPPSPFSPRTPLTPNLPLAHRTQKPVQQTQTTYLVDAPHSPLSWVWTCHQCHHSYHLGVTRRCLEDGHKFCSGTTTIKAWRKPSNPSRVRKHRACGSEFDYSGWKAWGRWRRGGKRLDSAGKKDCWNTCDYPSECRWGKKFGIHTPVEAMFPEPEVSSTMPMLTAPMNPNTTSEGILKPENCKNIKTDKEVEKVTFWGALLASAERRKSGGGHASSPLSTVTEEEEEEVDGDDDGDVVMSTIDPAPLATSAPEFEPEASSAVDSLKALISRKRYRRGRSSKLVLSNNYHERKYGISMLTVHNPELGNGDGEQKVPLSDADALLDLEGFEPLVRVQSRDSGYQSCSV